MNREWSEQNKTMQAQLKRSGTYEAGLATLFALREQLMQAAEAFRQELTRAEFDAMPFPRAEGYHSKTIAYSLWHIFRIEDIVAHTLIGGEEQIFFAGGYQARIRSPLITTGNELVGREIADFSRQLDLDALYAYMADVKAGTEALLRGLPYEALKQTIPLDRKEALRALHVVSDAESAAWLIDYWCSKNIRGLIQMPFSRHWIMHIEACQRIQNKLHPPR